jgi:hypothetical protein
MLQVVFDAFFLFVSGGTLAPSPEIEAVAQHYSHRRFPAPDVDGKSLLAFLAYMVTMVVACCDPADDAHLLAR